MAGGCYKSAMKRKTPAESRLARVRGRQVVLCLLLFLPAMLRGQEAVPPLPPSSSERFRALEKQADQASDRGETRPAIRLYLEALRIEPQWAEGWREVGVLLAQVKDYPRATVAFGNFLRLRPQDGGGWALRGLCEFELHRYRQALDDIQHGRELGVRDPALEKVATYHAALVFIEKGEFDVANRLLEHLAREGVNNPDLVAAFGLASLRMARLPGEWADAQQKTLALEAGQIAYEAVQGSPQKIISEYQALIQKYPRARGLHYALGNFLLDQANYGAALTEMQEELKLNPDDSMALLQAAMSELRLSHPERALPYAEKAVRVAPKLFAAHYTLGLTLYRLGRNPPALAELKRAVELEPNSPQAHYALSDAYLKAGDPKAALRERALFAQLKQKPTVAANFRLQNQGAPPSSSGAAPPSPEKPAAAPSAAFAQAEQDLREGHYPQAEAGFRKVLKAQPNLPAAYCDLGVVCLRTNRAGQAIRYFETARKLAPKLAGIDLDLGLAYYQEKDFKDAVPEFASVLAADPRNVQAAYLKGLCYFVMDRYAQTVATLQPLWKQESRNLDYLFVMGISYGKLKRTEACNKTFERLVEVGGNSPHFHLLLGKAYEGLYWNQQAYEELKKAVAGDPKLPNAHYSLGVVEMRLGKMELAGRAFDAEIALDPKSPWSYQKRGQVDLDLNQPGHAILMFQKALERDAKLPQSLGGIAKAYFMKGKFPTAVGYYQKALALQPDSADYHYQLGQTYLRLGQRADAQHEFAEAQKLQSLLFQKQQKTMTAPTPPPASR
jgi:tetratricopeptide (TPR) repeat protein